MTNKIVKFPKQTKINKIAKIINNFLKKLPINQQKNKEVKKMLFLVIIIGALSGYFIWHYFVENAYELEAKIPVSNNVSFNHQLPNAYFAKEIAEEFNLNYQNPILFYIYATWCKNCSKFMPKINELAREFQNTNLKVITLAIDKDINGKDLQNYLNKFGKIYFEPKYLASKSGFIEFLEKRGIAYNKYVPFTVLIADDNKIITKFSGSKSQSYLRKKIIKELNL